MKKEKKILKIAGISIWRILTYFIIYSIVGYIIETLFGLFTKGMLESRKGFLYGPFCPIYGVGAVAMILGLQCFKKNNYTLFFGGFLVGSIVEYIISYLGEVIFKVNWWDYSNNFLNINGRICLETLIPFGILGVAIMYGTNPILFKLYNQIPQLVINILTAILFIGFILDNIISSNIISSINVEGNKLIKDNTEEITEKIKQVLRQKSWLHRRLINAYPGLKDIKVKIKKVEQKIDERRKRKE